MISKENFKSESEFVQIKAFEECKNLENIENLKIYLIVTDNDLNDQSLWGGSAKNFSDNSDVLVLVRNCCIRLANYVKKTLPYILVILFRHMFRID